MTSRYRHRRTFDPAIAFPSPVEPGEIIVNTSNRQIAVGDANAGQLGVPKALIGVRFFDTTARYALNDVVVQAGNLYKANATIPPGAFNGANWTQLGVVTTMPAGSVVFTPTGNVISTDVQGAIAEVDAEKVAKAGDTMAGHLSLPTSPSAPNAVRKDYVDTADAALATLAGGKVDKGGDTMSGALVLPADPTVPLHAATKQYVDANTGSALVVSDTPPAGAKDGSLWWESDSGLLYVRYNDGNTIQWVIAAPQPDINAFATHAYVDAGDLNALKYSAQSLTALQQQQARQNIYAAPFDAMAYSGLQINGGMEVSQELGAALAAVNNNARYVVDGFGAAMGGTGTTSNAGQIAISTLPGFSYCLIFQATAANPLAASLDGQFVYQFIEGYRWSRLGFGTANAQPVTIGFWVNPNISGTMAVSIRNATSARSYVIDVPVVASIWQYKTVTIPGDTAGTWGTGNTGAAAVSFCFGAGSGRVGAANSWIGSANVVASAATTNFFATTGTIYLTGVIVLPGSEAPSAARSPFVMRSYDQELLVCRRYWQTVYVSAQFQATVVNGATTVPVYYTPGPMRATPTLVRTGTLIAGQSNLASVNIFASVPSGFGCQIVSAGAGDTYEMGRMWTCDARL